MTNGNDVAETTDETILQHVGALSGGERRVLSAAVSGSPHAEIHLLTSDGSRNDALWSRLAERGWMRRRPVRKPESDATRTYVIDQASRDALTRLIEQLLATDETGTEQTDGSRNLVGDDGPSTF